MKSGGGLVLGCESATPGNGGICRVSRLMAKVLTETPEFKAHAIVLNGNAPSDLFRFPASEAHGSRIRFVWAAQADLLRYSHFLYDSLNIARAHGLVPFPRRPFMTWIYGVEVWEGACAMHLRSARRASRLLAATRYTRDRADKLYGDFKRARVCWPGTETDEPVTAHATSSGPPTVLILGRMDDGRYKGHRELITCWPEVVEAVPDARLLIVGKGSSLGFFQRAAAESPASRSIEFKGFVQEDEIDGVWAETDVFAMPSRGEGFGLVYVEAMRQGVPVLASIHDAAPEINLDGVTGYNVDLNEPEHLRDRIIDLLRDPAERARLGRNGNARWREHFRFSSFRTRFVPFLNEFLEQC